MKKRIVLGVIAALFVIGSISTLVDNISHKNDGDVDKPGFTETLNRDFDNSKVDFLTTDDWSFVETTTIDESDIDTGYDTYNQAEIDTDFESNIADEESGTSSEPAVTIQVTTIVETKAPETKAPETKAPETKAPETKAPETKAPETKVPETKVPETKAPETTIPPKEHEIDGPYIVSVTSPVARNSIAELVFKGEPNTEYCMSVQYSSGWSIAEGLGKRKSDKDGFVVWTWKVGGKTKPGWHEIRIESLDYKHVVVEGKFETIKEK